MIMNRSIIQTLDLQEGQKWDKVKKHMKKNWKKYALRTAANTVAIGVGAYAGHKIGKSLSKRYQKNQSVKIPKQEQQTYVT